MKIELLGVVDHQIIHRSCEFDKILIAFGMLCESDQNVVSSAACDDRCVMKPILPRTPFADDLHVTTGKPLHKLDVVMGNIQRFENFRIVLDTTGDTSLPCSSIRK